MVDKNIEIATGLFRNSAELTSFIKDIVDNPRSCPEGFVDKFENPRYETMEYGIITGRIAFVQHDPFVIIRISDKNFYVSKGELSLRSEGFICNVWNTSIGWELPYFNRLKPYIIEQLANIVGEVDKFREALKQSEVAVHNSLIDDLLSEVSEEVKRVVNIDI